MNVTYSIFPKFYQHLDVDRLAALIARIGCDTTNLVIRDGYWVTPGGLAAEAPTFFTSHFPSSFYPRTAEPGVMVVEGRIPDKVRMALQSRGHTVRVTGEWSSQNAHATMSAGGLLSAAVSPRLETGYAMGW